ncbi:Acetyl-coenzyme A synthetase 1 (plasmid) [Cupriavidus taiwanensis]|uniref:Acetyl-coenzyme A synthetase 1 n=1 Tax=Cupriavidus taiwanensis TaxID=164546 RepID=A0A375I626_9BURK|nr:acetoacetate--CoA ligase [Cupriavidus taiwanensis]SPK70057.1 Acetyl-coenzyme A synthetase 1 [Cupriavidus taiwanensis]SPK74864.1 Acetyl-coenzyme A synthetase 1 [Cupriavidus taiwanensis]
MSNSTTSASVASLPEAEAPAWAPSSDVVRRARITAFQRWLKQERGLAFSDYDALWQWSVEEIDAFWLALWQWADIPSPRAPRVALADASMPGATWFPGVQMNYVQQVFRHATTEHPAIVHRNESGETGEMSWAELQRQVASVAATLRGMGVDRGDRVAAFLPNTPQTIVAFLAVASIGAVWSACSPDMGELAVLDRFRQIEPKVLVAVDGYRYGGKAFDRRPLLHTLLEQLPSVEGVILVPGLAQETSCHDFRFSITWTEATAMDLPLEPELVPFDHPLWIVYSSGTTGLPKPIVHSQGGIVLEHVKLTTLHLDLNPGDRFYWQASTGWIMWNLQVGGLLAGATVCLFDGNPGYPNMETLWRFIGEKKIDFFGAGAAYFQSCLKAGVEPCAVADLSRLRGIGSTGSPLSPEGYRWILDHVGPLWINALSGGTDFAGCFVAGVPTLPVYLGEMQCRCLGARVEAFDEAGQPLIDEVGELVCAAPMPSMPLCFWNDQDNQRYRDSYFDTYPGIWRHGDWVRITPRGGAVIYGRSDATINRHGIRMGTSELYRAVEALPEVLDCMVVDLEYLGRESYMPLFVVLRRDVELTPGLTDIIRERIKVALSARHVPNDVFQVAAIPRTLSGKKMELPIKKLLLGQPLEKVANPDTMANPESLAWYAGFARDRAAAAR